MRKKKNQQRAIFLASMLAILFLGITSIKMWEQSSINNMRAHANERLQQTESVKADMLKTKMQQEYVPKIKYDEEIKQKDQEIERIKLSKAQAKTKVTTSRVVSAQLVDNCGDNFYANYIYMHESHCNTAAKNEIGCFGIGQSCPASKIGHCGTNYACQNAWFTNYSKKYGGWEGAYKFWLANHWW